MEIVPLFRTDRPPLYGPRPSRRSTALPSLWSVLPQPRFMRLAFLMLVLPPYILPLVLIAQLFSQPGSAPAVKSALSSDARLVCTPPAPRLPAVLHRFRWQTLAGLRRGWQ